MKTITGMALATIVCATGLNFIAIAAGDSAPTPPTIKEEAKTPPAQTGDGNAARSTLERKEHAEDQKYTFGPIVGMQAPGKHSYMGYFMSCGVLNGPGLEADFNDTDDMDVDDTGNVYWTESGACNILRKWDRQTKLVTTLAGSVCGQMDGPAGSARFGGWGGGGYSGSNLQVSCDGKHVFIKDGALLRHLDVEADTVTTIGKGMIAAKNKNGDVGVLSYEGAAVPEGKGYKALKTPKLKLSFGPGFFTVLDLDKNRLYWHNRGPVIAVDLKTGESQALFSGGRQGDTSGPLETTSFQCPVGIALSPGGRFIYVGGGDSSSFWRLDLEKKHVLIFSQNADGVCSFQEGKEFTKETAFCKWPSVARFSADGSAAWSSPSGIFRLTPIQKETKP